MSVVYEGKNIIGNLVVIRSEDKDGNRGFAFNCQPIIDDDTARALADAIYNDLGLGWLPYPENKPEDTGLYSIYFITTSKGVVDTDYYDDFDEEWRRYDDVIAFMRYPSKYQPA